MYAEAEGTQVKCIADLMNGVLLNVATIEEPPKREKMMDIETHEEELSQKCM